MPVVSQAQRRAMYAAAEGKSNLGIPKSVGEEFVSASHGITGLPARKKQSGAREQPRRHFGSFAPHRVVIHVFPHHEEWQSGARRRQAGARDEISDYINMSNPGPQPNPNTGLPIYSGGGIRGKYE